MLAQKMESGKVLRRKLPKKTWKMFALNGSGKKKLKVFVVMLRENETGRNY